MSNPEKTVSSEGVSHWRLLCLAALVLLLGACSGALQDGAPTLEPTAESAGTWHARLLAALDKADSSSDNLRNPELMVKDGDTYKTARIFNNYVTSMIVAYRTTGDRSIVGEIDGYMNVLRGKLKDYNGDGYLNLRYLNGNADSSSSPFYNTDYHIMDEMMSHALIASVAYTFKQAGFSEDANFWKGYLQNHFEKKWRQRKGKPSGFPFLDKDLIHTYAQWIRYHYFMYKLTGNGAYYTEAKRMAANVKNHMVTVSSNQGSAFVWDHRIDTGKHRSRLGCQHTVYVRLTTQAFQELAMQNAGLFDSSFMKKVANGMSAFVLRRTDGSEIAKDICGGVSRGGLEPNASKSSSYNLWYFSYWPYANLAKWDSSGRLKTAAQRAYEATERRSLSSPTGHNLPATMVSLGN